MKQLIGWVCLSVMFFVPAKVRASDGPNSGVPAPASRWTADTPQSPKASPAAGQVKNDLPLETLLADFESSRASIGESDRVRESPAAYSVPVGDPNDRFAPNARPPLSSNGLDRVVVKFAGLPPLKPVLVAFLTPDLAPASAIEVRRAFGQLLWKPTVEEKETATQATLLLHLEH